MKKVQFYVTAPFSDNLDKYFKKYDKLHKILKIMLDITKKLCYNYICQTTKEIVGQKCKRNAVWDP